MESSETRKHLDMTHSQKRSHSRYWHDDNEPVPKHRPDVLPPNISTRECMFCQKTKTRSKKRVPISVILTEKIVKGNCLFDRMQEKKDDQLMSLLRTHERLGYHKDCFAKYIKKTSDTKPYTQKIDKASVTFSKLCDTVEKDIIQYGKTRRLVDILKQYKALLAEDMNAMPNFKSRRLKEKLKKHFGNKLQFWQPTSMVQSEIVFSSKIQVGEILAERIDISNIQSDNETGSSEETDEMRTLYHASMIIKKELGKIKAISMPPARQEINGSSFEIPVKVYNMVAWVVSSVKEFTREMLSIPDSDHRLVVSLVQDMLFMMSNGRISTPKHVALAVAVKSITGSPETVSILNRFGHSISYGKLKEVELVLAKQEAMISQTSSLPSNISPNVFLTFCYDNNDFKEETLTGKSTTHCTNGIVIQQGVDSCQIPPKNSVDKETQKKIKATEILPMKILPFNTTVAKSPEYPEVVLPMLNNIDSCIEDASKADFAWFIVRLGLRDDLTININEPQTIPGWSGFNSIIHRKDAPRESVVTYLPVIDSSPTEFPTVYTILMNTIKMGTQHGQSDHAVVVDQAIYAKAQQIVWQKPTLFKSIVLRLGDFHVCMTYLAVLGKRFQDAGLSDILIESGIIATGSQQTLFSGKHYNRAIRVHKIVCEALQRLRWEAFIDTSVIDAEEYSPLLQVMRKLRSSMTKQMFCELIDLGKFSTLKTKYEAFCTEEDGPMKQYWSSYIDMVQLLLHFIRATRQGLWDLHKACIRKMLPYMFAYDRLNYARYMTLYWAEMSRLENAHPEANREFLNGNFGVQRSKNGFSKVAVDQTIEQTINKSTKTRGGIIGFSLKKNSVNKWILSANERAAITDDCKLMAGLGSSVNQIHKEEGKARLKLDESNVKQVMDTVNRFQNPFLPSKTLTHLSSGRVADEQTTDDLLNAEEKGDTALQQFVHERICSKEKDLTDPIKKLNLKTFAVAHTKNTKGQNNSTNDRNLFGRLLVIAQSRKIELIDLFKHELGNYPSSLATSNGAMHQTTKSKLVRTLEKRDQSINCDVNGTAHIFDAMSLFQSVQRAPDTFSALAALVFERIVTLGSKASRLDFVCDTYHNISIKAGERAKRAGNNEKMIVKVTNGSQKCPSQWKKYLLESENKTNLIQFVVDEWKRETYKSKLGNISLFVTTSDLCYRIMSTEPEAKLVPELISTQEEADTRLLLHASHASDDGHQSIIIHSRDTDVEILALYHQPKITANIYIQTGTQTLPRLVDIRHLSSSLGPKLCAALPGLHSLSGCDTTSSFFGKGKQKMLQLARSDNICEVLSELGVQVPIGETLLNSIESLVCRLYGPKGISDINRLRYSLFSKNPDIKSNHLPPTKDALDMHTKRANYQAFIWKNALDSLIQVPSPIENGWKIVNNNLTIEWTKNAAAPKTLLQLVACGCKGECDTGRCSCHSTNLHCTDTCKCKPTICTNRDKAKVDESDESDNEAVYEGVDDLGGISFAWEDEELVTI